MEFLRSIYYLIAPYTDARERVVAKFFAGLTEHSSGPSTKARLNELLQDNIAVINLWTEYRYKGYTYLKKKKRRQLYANLDAITTTFDEFYKQTQYTADEVRLQIHGVAPHAHTAGNHAVLLYALMEFFSPNRGVYEYRDSSSFGRLLRDPNTDQMVGDCNQIVTLYIYLFSRYFSINELKIRLLPGHVALHCGGVDIEATNATFANYDESEGQQLLPIEEIASVNLLDTTDTHFAQHEVKPEDFLQASRFAFILSHNRDIVTHNLEAAYSKLINSLMERNNYSAALKFAKQSKDIEILSIVGHNGALYHMEHGDFAAARRYAEHAVRRAELVKDSYRAEGVHHYDAGRYHDAIKAFHHYGDQELVKKCYEALCVTEQKNLGDNLTSETIKQYAPVIKRMYGYAKKSGNKQLIEHANALRKYI
jgi:hypothetical protein